MTVQKNEIYVSDEANRYPWCKELIVISRQNIGSRIFNNYLLSRSYPWGQINDCLKRCSKWVRKEVFITNTNIRGISHLLGARKNC